MQTFLPLPNFQLSAKVLDWRRLGKQRLEAAQLLKAMYAQGAWSNHPACKMWKGYTIALQHYHDIMILEWKSRGYKNTMELFLPNLDDMILPFWFGDSAFHASHRSNLLRKDSAYYGKFGWTEPQDLPYVWPLRKEAA